MLKQYDQAIEWSRRAIAVRPDVGPIPYFELVAALALRSTPMVGSSGCE